ncbi:MAG: DUF1501 domain-containing protein [Ignavibacteria bacterium]|nr:DUF1501 domain-containing protein [Ignavibacteria bacterium]
MNRRDFIQKTVPLSFLPFFIGGYSIKAFGRSPFLESLISAATETNNVLVLIQLNGGNDGLNTVLPIDQYSNLSNARSNILIAENKILKLTNATGLHPAMTGMKKLYDSGKLSVVQSVGYPNPNFSHFRATDIWLTASDSNQHETSGWMGRYLSDQNEFPEYPTGYPNSVMPDPLAIQIGSVISSGLQGYSANMGMAITSPTNFYQFISNTVDPAPNTPAGHELTYIRQVAQQTNLFAGTIKNAAAKATNKSTLYPVAPDNSLGDQLKIVARLIAGGLKTRIYIVSIGGFDTHSIQAVAGETETGTHANLLRRLSSAIEAFQDDIKLLGAEDRVLGMTFSEFGRRIKSNSSGGTDHGSAAPLFLFGKNVKSGILGSNPIISSSVSANDNVPMQYDFRSVYASVLKSWFGVPDAELQRVLFKNFQSLPIITSTNIATHDDVKPNRFELFQNYPNPFNPSTKIRFNSSGSNLTLKVYDMTGKEIQTIAEGNYPSGSHEVTFSANGLPSGIYYYRLQSGSYTEMKAMTLVK